MLAAIEPQPNLHDFFSRLGAKYVDGLQGFLYKDMPHLVLIILCAWALIWAVSLATNHIVHVAERHASGAAHVSQVRTLSSVVRATGIAIIAFLAVLQVVPLFGFNLGPLLTSAGVAGVAIGLAAQTIVKDCLNGMLILVEAQYNVGDIVTIAGLSGTVENMSLRKTMLRGFDGVLYVIPNSQITIVANKVRDFSVATINVSVDFSADPDKVLALLMNVAMSVRNDPAYKDLYLADPSLLGVDAIKGSQVIYMLQIRTKANQQWAPMRETQRRIRIALAENKILPGDPLRVYKGTPAIAGAHAALAAESVDESDPTAAKANEINPFSGEGL